MKSIFGLRWLALLIQIIVLHNLLPTPLLGELKDYPHLQAELISEHRDAYVSKTTTIALRLVPEKGWHIYWRNPGDVGSAPKLKWKVNNQTVTPRLFWPTPEIIPYGPFTNYGYRSELLISAPINIPETLSSHILITLEAEWLICKEECIPGRDLFTLKLPVLQTDSAPFVKNNAPKNTSLTINRKAALLFKRHKKRIPTSSPLIRPQLSSLNNSWQLHLDFPLLEDHHLTFIPYTSGFMKYTAEQKTTHHADSTLLELKKASNLNKEVQKASPNNRYEIKGLLLKREKKSDKEILWEDGSTSKEISLSLD